MDLANAQHFMEGLVQVDIHSHSFLLPNAPLRLSLLHYLPLSFHTAIYITLLKPSSRIISHHHLISPAYSGIGRVDIPHYQS